MSNLESAKPDKEQFLDLLAQANAAVRIAPDANEAYERLSALESWMQRFDAAHPSVSGFSVSVGGQRTQREREITRELIHDESTLASIDDLLDEMASRYQVLLRKRSIRCEHVEQVILPPIPDQKIKKGKGSGAGFINHPHMDRRRLLFQLLSAAGLDEGILDTDGIVSTNMMRTESYHLIDIPSVRKQILICDLMGEAVFVIDEIHDIGFYTDQGMNKDVLGRMPNVHRITFHTESKWCHDILMFLRGEAPTSSHSDAITAQAIIRDRQYYMTSLYVLTDLQRFAEVNGIQSPVRLTTRNLCSSRITCANGDKAHGAVYLADAAVQLGIVAEKRLAQSKRLEALQKLKEIAGYEVNWGIFNAAYFSNPLNIRYDIRTFAEEAGNADPVDLSTAKAGSLEIIASNGQRVKLYRYLMNAAVAFGLAEKVKDGSKYLGETLKRLKVAVGYSVVPQLLPRDPAYYNDQSKVRSDFNKFLEASDVENIEALTINDFRTQEILCADGRQMKGAMYLTYAAMALGIAQTQKEANNKRYQALMTLKRNVGCEIPEYLITKYRKVNVSGPKPLPQFPMDHSYFSNAEYVKKDLQDFALQSEVDRDALTITYTSTSVDCCNGEQMTLGTYLSRAAIVLGYAKGSVEAKKESVKTLDNLKLIAGFQVMKFAKQDADYFSDPARIDTDLKNYAEAEQVDGPKKLTTAMKRLKVTCQNGEHVLGVTYLNRAAIALGLACNTREAHAKNAETLDVLKSIVIQNSVTDTNS